MAEWGWVESTPSCSGHSMASERWEVVMAYTAALLQRWNRAFDRWCAGSEFYNEPEAIAKRMAEMIGHRVEDRKCIAALEAEIKQTKAVADAWRGMVVDVSKERDQARAALKALEGGND